MITEQNALETITKFPEYISELLKDSSPIKRLGIIGAYGLGKRRIIHETLSKDGLNENEDYIIIQDIAGDTQSLLKRLKNSLDIAESKLILLIDCNNYIQKEKFAELILNYPGKILFHAEPLFKAKINNLFATDPYTEFYQMKDITISEFIDYMSRIKTNLANENDIKQKSVEAISKCYKSALEKGWIPQDHHRFNIPTFLIAVKGYDNKSITAISSGFPQELWKFSQNYFKEIDVL